MERILTELRQMRLPGMAQTWQNLMETHQASSLNIIDGLRILLQGEHDMRRANRNARLLKNARFRYQVSVDELAYDSARGLDRADITQLCSGEYIRRGIPVIITGATGTGKKLARIRSRTPRLRLRLQDPVLEHPQTHGRPCHGQSGASGKETLRENRLIRSPDNR